MRIASVLDISLVDVPGIPVTVIFTGGCNFDCPYCHNASLIPHDSGQELPIDEIVSQSTGHLSDGFCITGGEPTLHPDLPDLLRALKEQTGSHINLNTQGSFPAILRKCLPYLDSVWFDLKASRERYATVVRTKYDPWPKVEESFRMIMDSDVALWPRTTYAAGLMSPDDILGILEFLGEVGFSGEYLIKNYIHSSGVREEAQHLCIPPKEEDLADVVNHAPPGVTVRFEWVHPPSTQD